MMATDWWFLAPVLALAAGVLALAPLGAQVLARGVVFIDLAVAQAAAAAALAALALADHPSWLVTQLTAATGALAAAALVAALARWWPEHREALIGLVYVGCACAALLIARQDAHGAEHLHALLAADVLWSGWPQVATLAGCALAVALLRRRLADDAWFFVAFALVASLAVLGYSVNESVVIFDRIRETFRRRRKLNTVEVIDHAITSTISRTIITHGSTQMMVLSMLIFGGPTLHYFALALTVGILFGIYSSVFVAAAIAMWLGIKREDLVKAGSKEIDPNDPNSGAVV